MSPNTERELSTISSNFPVGDTGFVVLSFPALRELVAMARTGEAYNTTVSVPDKYIPLPAEISHMYGKNCK
jgi:hypothetical protein